MVYKVCLAIQRCEFHQLDELSEGMVTTQYSCLENLRDRESWWATLMGLQELDRF